MTELHADLLAAAPASVVNRAEICERFGTEALTLVLETASTGDPPADAVMAELAGGAGPDKAVLDQGIRHRLASLASPPSSVRALLEQAESIPDWVAAEQIRRGAEAYLLSGALWLSIALGAGSLAHTYSAPTISRILMETGNLDVRAPRRLAETAVWNREVIRPGGLAVGAAGYVHTLQVRMLHARVRAGLLRKGWDRAWLGMPISQLDMARTWLDFTTVPLIALGRIGIEFSDREVADIYRLWQLVAHQLGIDPRLYGRARDQASGAALLDLIDSANAGPDDGARVLIERMLHAMGRAMHPMLHLPAEAAIQLMSTLCRLFHGDAFADRLGIARNETVGLLPGIIDGNRRQCRLERENPALRRQKIIETLAAFDRLDQSLTGPTAYQTNIRDLSLEALPQTGSA
jgi:hypothetical protein